MVNLITGSYANNLLRVFVTYSLVCVPAAAAAKSLQSCLTLCDAMICSTPGFPVLHCPLKFAQTHVHWVGDAIQPSHSLSPLLLVPSIFPSIRVFSNELALRIRWPNYWSFSISPSNEYSELISFRIDWFDFIAVQGTRKSLLQHHSSKASILRLKWKRRVKKLA